MSADARRARIVVRGLGSSLTLSGYQDKIEKRFRVDVQIIIERDGRHMFAKFHGARGVFLIHAEYKTEKDKLLVVNGMSCFFSGRPMGEKKG